MDVTLPRAARAASAKTIALVRHRHFGTLAAIAVVLALVGTFTSLADEVLDGETRAVEERFIVALRNPQDPTLVRGPPLVTEVVRDATALGGGLVLTLFTGVAVGYLLLVRKRHAALYLLACSVGGTLLSGVMKGALDRPRPDVVPHLSIVESSSFPSGHSLLAAVLYLGLAAVLVNLVQRRRLKLFVVAVAVTLTALVGASRVILGVHYPTDVAGGWLLGAAWAVSCAAVMRWLQERDVVEEPHEVTPRDPTGPPSSTT